MMFINSNMNYFGYYGPVTFLYTIRMYSIWGDLTISPLRLCIASSHRCRECLFRSMMFISGCVYVFIACVYLGVDPGAGV